MKNVYVLFPHIKDGGAVYLTDNDTFGLANIIIRIDGGVELLKCDIDSESDEPTDDSFERDWCGFCDMSVDADVEGSRLVCPHCGTYI